MGMRVIWSLRVVACALLACVPASPARAGFINVGSIVIDQYAEFRDATRAGADFTLHYGLNEAFEEQTCVTRDSLRWIQMLQLSKSIKFGDEDTPARPFIDPREGQFTPGAPNDKGDNLPFYDLTYATEADVGKKDKVVVNGSGVYLFDQPRVSLGARPFSFTAVTLLVSIQPNQQLGVLGGVRWGWRVKDDASVILFGAEYVAGNSALTRTFNRALASDFPGWEIKLPKELWPTDQPAVDLAERIRPPTPVPAPASIVLLGLGGLVLLGRSRLSVRTALHER